MPRLKKPVKARRVVKMLLKSDLRKVTEPRELTGVDFCYHIGAMHEDAVSPIDLSRADIDAKQHIVKLIKKGTIYVKQEEQ